jgi:outer membrane protein TolC
VAVFGFSDDAADVASFRKAIFRMILSRAKERLTDPADIKELEVSEATDGISFELFDDAQRARLVEAVYQGTRDLRQQVAEGRPTEEPVREGAVEKLDEILALLSRFR